VSGENLQRISQNLEQFVFVTAAQSQFRAVFQNDRVFAREHRLQFLDAFDVDDCRAVNADEFLRIELRFQRAERLADEMRFVSSCADARICRRLESSRFPRF
jgi:hypothetical protein